ncbi:MAG: T9SS type A sorting domain-containing protein [Ignavibacterium sp.]|nr:T9SS type A sorting domain-containing protein [Ignavibacterium sp.]
MDNSTGVYQIWTAPITLPPVSVEYEQHLVSGFKLNQNYPNPFNPSTKISWLSRTGSWHTLKVLDILGGEIITLVNEYKPAGSYEIEFNSNDSGNRNKLTSGIYFYRLQTGEFSETKPMVLLK